MAIKYLFFTALVLLGLLPKEKKTKVWLVGDFRADSLPQRLTVAADGSGDYRTVQAALDAVPVNNTKEITIYIKKGVYREKLQLDSTHNHVTLVGEDAAGTILTYADHPGMVLANGDSVNTRNSHSCLIKADDFSARHLTFRNDAGYGAGQAVAHRKQATHFTRPCSSLLSRCTPR